MRKLRPWEGKGLAQSYLPNKLRSWRLTPACMVAISMFFAICGVSPLQEHKRASGEQVTIHLLQGKSQTAHRVVIMQNGPVTEGLSTTIWDSKGMYEPLGLKVSEPKYTVWCVYLICLVTLCPPLKTQGPSTGFFFKTQIVNLVSHMVSFKYLVLLLGWESHHR